MFKNYILNEITKEKNHIINQLDNNYCKANAIRKRRKKSLKIYHQTEEYQASLEEALAKSKRYQKLISEHATEDEDLKKEYDAFEQRQKEQKEREKKRQEEKRLQQLRVQEKLTEMEQCLKKLDFTPLLKKYTQKRIREIEQSYSLDVISVETYDDYFQSNYIYNKKYSELSAENFDDFINSLEYIEWSNIFIIYEDIFDDIFHAFTELQKFKEDDDLCDSLTDYLTDIISDYDYEMEAELSSRFTKSYILELIRKNPHYCLMIKDMEDREQKLKQEKQELEERREFLRKTILQKIPDNYIDFFPEARKIKRNFILHIGPTNSGKTFHATQALKSAKNGIYLAPLRLLAIEQYVQLNKEGFPCSLITGEEEKYIENSFFQSSTIEMANLTRQYAVAVIDEAQMIKDPDRGGAWTAAILGICAKEIHICAASEAEEILIKLIQDCKDSYKILHYERQCPLICEKQPFSFPSSVKKHDALIVFSKKSVHAIAGELQRTGTKCSMIYGSLPYEVRKNEADKFIAGETDVLVATDAIGMGLNLPIERIVFLETTKFDGKTKRRINPEEIRQIAGRAGRKGIYDVGYYNADTSIDFIQKSILVQTDPIKKAVLAFPTHLLYLNAPLSEIFERWNELHINDAFVKQNLERELHLCKFMENYSKDKQIIYKFSTIPFNENSEQLMELWTEMFFAEIQGDVYPFPLSAKHITSDIHSLEENYRICDLFYCYYRRFHHTKFLEDTETVRKKITKRLIEILSHQKLPSHKCRCCEQEFF